MSLAFSVAGVVVLTGCATHARVAEVTAETRLARVTADGRPVTYYGTGWRGDDVVRFREMDSEEGAVLLAIENRSASEIRVLWEAGSHLNWRGLRGPIARSETLEGLVRDGLAAPGSRSTTIPPRATTQLWIALVQGSAPLPDSLPSLEAAGDLCNEIRGSDVGLRVPVEGAASTREYSLVFTIESVRVGLKSERSYSTCTESRTGIR